MRPAISFLLAASLLLPIGGCKKSPPATVTDGADWTAYGRTTDEQRFSPLTQINEQTMGRLGLLWSRELGTTHGLEATPLVSNGVIYTTGQWSVAYALDARTGEILWTFDPKVSRANVRTICCDTVNRGAALYHDKVYLGTLDGRLIALDAKSGKPVWDMRHRRPVQTLRHHRRSPHRERDGSHRQCRRRIRCARLSLRLRRGDWQAGLAHLHRPR